MQKALKIGKIAKIAKQDFKDVEARASSFSSRKKSQRGK